MLNWLIQSNIFDILANMYNATKSCFAYLCVLREKADGNHHELVCHDSSRVLIDRPGRLNSNRFQQVRKTCFLLKRESVT